MKRPQRSCVSSAWSHIGLECVPADDGLPAVIRVEGQDLEIAGAREVQRWLSEAIKWLESKERNSCG